MARNPAESSATVSVLDRLIDLDPTNPYEAAMSRAESVRNVKVAVRRDLEWLLNARRIAVEPPEGLKEVNRSVYMYGLPDLTAFSMGSARDRSKLVRMLQNAVRIFEPRLANVRVVPTESNETNRHTLSFRIDGMLIMNPAPEHISFDTVLELSNGEYSVKGDADAR